MKLHTGETLADATKGWAWEQREALGQRYIADIAGDLFHHWREGPKQYQSHIVEPLGNARRSFELDGYAWDGTRLIANESDVLDTREESGLLQALYQELGLSSEDTTFHHLKLTEDHYLSERWDDSIANSRKFLEATLAQVAASYGKLRGIPVSDDALSRPAAVRDYLEREGLLEDKEKKAVAAIYSLLSETGGHPYVAHKEEARLMRHLALTFAQFVMLRLRTAKAQATKA